MLIPLVEKKNDKYDLSYYDTDTGYYYGFKRLIVSWEGVEKLCNMLGCEKPFKPNGVKKKKETNIYFIKCGDRIKIGKADCVESRFHSLNLTNGSDLELLFYYKADISEEKKLHNKFSKHRIKGEWFMFDKSIKKFLSQKNAADFA